MHSDNRDYAEESANLALMAETDAGPSVTVWTIIYAPWEEDADERGRLSEESSVYDFDTLEELAEYMRREGLELPSGVNHDGTFPGESTWYSCESYEHPYEGTLEERTAHPLNLTASEREQLWRYVAVGDEIPATD